MDKCPRCGCVSSPKLVTEEDKRKRKWIISRCPREDCGYNYDLRRYSRSWREELEERKQNETETD